MSEGTQSPTTRHKPFTVTNGMIAGIAIPMTLAYMTTPLLGLVDTAVVGRFGDPALIGGLAVGAILIDLIFTTFNFLRSGTTGLAAQAYGAGDEKEKQAILIRALMIAGGGGAIMIVLSPVLVWAGLWFISPSQAVADVTAEYFFLRILATPFALANYVILGWVVGIGRAGLGLALQLLINGSNIVLSIWLGLYLEWGVAGVAVATVIGEALASIVGGFICWRMCDPANRPSGKRIKDRAAINRLMNLNADIMIRSFLLLFAFAFFTRAGAGLGETALAANAILLHFFMIGGYFLDGLATAAEQLAGRAIGARHRPAFWQSLKMTSIWNGALALTLSLALLFLGPLLIDTLTTAEGVRAFARDYLAWAAFTPLVGVLAFQMDGVFIGATWSREMTKSMILSVIAYLIVWWLVAEPFGNSGLWFALYVFLIFRGITLGARVPAKVRQTFSDA